jgi:hypothetical protein
VAWAAWLDELGIEHSGVIDTDRPIPYSVVVFRDPDNVQLELFRAVVTLMSPGCRPGCESGLIPIDGGLGRRQCEA